MRVRTVLAGALIALVPSLAAAQVQPNLPAANTVYAGPTSGTPAAPSFRALVPADLGSALTSAAFDAAFCSTTNAMLVRGASVWACQTTLPAALMPALTGDVANTAGSLSTTVQPGVVTNAKLASMAANTVKGSVAGGTPADLNAPFMSGGTAGQVLTKNSSTAGDASWRDQCLNIESFGGVGNNSTDNTTPLNNALAALTGNGGCIYFPPGKYKFNSAITYNFTSGIFSVALVGSGQDNTILTWPSASGGMTFNYAGINSSTHFRDLSITTGTTNGGNAIALNLSTSVANPAAFAQSDLYRVTIRGDDGYSITDYWSNGVNVSNVSNINFNGLSIYGPSTPNGTGISLVGLPGSSTYAVQFNVAQSVIQSLGTGILYGSFIQGATVDATNFTGSTNAIAAAGSETGTLAQLSVTNSQFNGGSVSKANGILALTGINGLQIANNLFLVPGTSGTAISLPQSKLTTIVGNVFWGQNAATSEQGVSIANTNSLPCVIQGNIFFGFNGTTSTGLSLGASAANCAVGGNSFLTNTTNVSDSGTNNQFWNNPGFDAWTAFTASPACGSATITTNSARRKTVGKTTFVEYDINITALGTCTNSLTVNLPNTANCGAAIIGRGVGSGAAVALQITNGASTATGNNANGTNFATGQIVMSGVYENQ